MDSYPNESLNINQIQRQNAQSFSDIDYNVLVTNNSASHTEPLYNITDNNNLASVHLLHLASQLTDKFGRQVSIYVFFEAKIPTLIYFSINRPLQSTMQISFQNVNADLLLI